MPAVTRRTDSISAAARASRPPALHARPAGRGEVDTPGAGYFAAESDALESGVYAWRLDALGRAHRDPRSEGESMKRLLLSIVIALAAMRLAVAAPAAPDVIYYNAKFVTVDAKGTVASAVAIKDGKFVAVGDAQSIKKTAGPSTRLVDLGGKLVVPGFIDGHTHPVETARMKEAWVDARYPETPSVKQALANITARAQSTPKGKWIFVAASSGSENKFAEHRLPTKAELDAAAPDHPVIFLNGAHELMASTLALQALGVKKGVARLPHGGIVQFGADGEPTGDVIEAEGDVPDHPSAADVTMYYTQAIPDIWNANGFTSVNAITMAEMLPVLNAVATSKNAPRRLRFTVPVWTDPAGKFLPADLTTLGVAKGADPAFFRTGGVKAWVDGEVDARTGAVYQPYCGHFDTDIPGGLGNLNIPQPNADLFAQRANDAGLTCMMHCSADHSTDIALHAYEKVQATGKPRAIQRIEHFGVFMITDEEIKRAAKLGIKMSVQPGWLTTLGKSNVENLGEARAKTGFRFRSMIDAGLEPACGTDVTGIYLNLLNPFIHMGACVDRISDMGPFVPSEAVTVMEALKMWTIWPARAIGQGDQAGSIEVGKYADMVVLSDDIFSIPVTSVKTVKPLTTIVGGNVVYQAK